MGLPFWPGGDPGAMRHAAGKWRGIAKDMRSAVETAQPAMTTLFSSWHGEAATAFESAWSDFADTHRKGAEGAEAMAKALDEVAKKLDEAHSRFNHMLEVMAATAVVGIGLSVLTGGLAGGAAVAAESAVASEMTMLLVELGVELEAAAALATEAALAVGAAVECVVGVSVDFAIGLSLGAGSQVLDEALDHEKINVNWDQAALAGLASAVLEPLTAGRSTVVRVARGATAMGTVGLMGQVNGMIRDGKHFDPTALLVDVVAGAAGGKLGEGPEAKELKDLVGAMERSPALADLIEQDTDWLRVISADPDILVALEAQTIRGVVVVTPEGIATMTQTVRTIVLETAASPQLAALTAKAMRQRMVSKAIDLADEDVKVVLEHATEAAVEESGGAEAVEHMSPSELRALADRILASIPDSVRAPVHAHAS